jgi:hypothetical protein
MSLDLHNVLPQIQSMATTMRQRHSDQKAQVQIGFTSLISAESTRLEKKRTESKVTWLIGIAHDQISAKSVASNLPKPHTVVAVDGSHIDVDRHSPARCYLINIGTCQLTYGPEADAKLSSQATLYATDQDLVISDPESSRTQQIEGPLLGLKRTILEITSLANALETLPDGGPVVGLLDGSLILWELASQAYPDFIRRHLLHKGLLPALDRLHEEASSRPLALAAYISLPRSTDVVNLLRLHHCPYEPANCDLHCRQIPAGQRGCDPVNGLLDRDIFGSYLDPGERSQVFGTTSQIVQQYYGIHQVYFFYVNTGEEIGRVEIPQWVARDPDRLDLVHTLILDQCNRGQGYPVALSEAHEQAVVTAADRLHFEHLVEETLQLEMLPTSTSQKSRSKRTRWV